MKKLNYLFDYFKFLKNPISALMFKFGFKKECEIKLKNSNVSVKLTSISSLNRLMIQLPITINKKYAELSKYIKDIDDDKEVVVIDDINYVNIYNNNFVKSNPNNYNICNEEYFADDQWDMIDFNNRHVIDIGANIGDTALYFAKENAKVIAFEPVKHLYELGLENISLNPTLKDKINFINKAVGGKRGNLTIGNETTKTYINKNDSYQIEVITVRDVLEEYEFPADILKMDCEGCEFEVIINEDLTMFNDIIFEHHSKQVGKDYKPLIKKLEDDGFKIDKYPVFTSKLDFEDIGIIHAYK